VELVLVLLMGGDVLCPKDIVTDVKVDVDALRRADVGGVDVDVADVVGTARTNNRLMYRLQ
jgi:hypothetical protein